MAWPMFFPTARRLLTRSKTLPVSYSACPKNRSWIELFFEGDLMHTKTVNLPAGSVFDIYVEEIPHKATVYEHPRTMIFFNGPCDVRTAREGNRIVVNGALRTGIPP